VDAECEPEVLLIQARQGDERSLGSLLEYYRHYLLLLARVQIGRRLQGKVDVEDVLQEVSLQAHRCFSKFRGVSRGEFEAWLRRILGSILANLVRRYHGTQRRNPRLEVDLAADLDRSSRAVDCNLVASQSSPSQIVSRQEQCVLLANALAGLPSDYREVIILRQLEELSFPEVSERMGRSLDSVKNLWARALARLRRELVDQT
jgi:RNA polymerase sigma-70 factor, ECF subfamily